MNLTTATPVEIDTEIAAIYVRYYAKTREVATQERYLESDQRRLEQMEAGTYRYHFDQYDIDRAKDSVARLEAKVATLREQALEIMRETAPFNAEFKARGGWSRFYLVDNKGGHVHSSMACSTCFPTTEFVWLPEYSGSSEEALVAAAGEQACTVCFPSAPVDVLKRKSTIEAPARRAARLEREAKKAATLAKKVEKALFADDVTKVFRTSGKWGERIGTIAAAKKFLTDGCDWGWGHPSYALEDRDQVASLLAERLGTTPEEEIEAAKKRAAKRR